MKMSYWYTRCGMEGRNLTGVAPKCSKKNGAFSAIEVTRMFRTDVEEEDEADSSADDFGMRRRSMASAYLDHTSWVMKGGSATTMSNV